MNQVVERAKRILLSPKTEWQVIKTQSGTSMDILKNYLIYLIAIPVVAQFIGRVIVGMPFVGRIGFFSGLVYAVVLFVLTILGIYIAAFVINLLAPTFNGQKDEQAAFKVVAYSYTAPLVAGVFNIIPALSPLSILGLYGIYLLYLGLPELMNCPKDKALLYTIVSILVIFVISVLIGALSTLFICR